MKSINRINVTSSGGGLGTGKYHRVAALNVPGAVLDLPRVGTVTVGGAGRGGRDRGGAVAAGHAVASRGIALVTPQSRYLCTYKR